ncbi:prolyl-tRNA editing enzyme YbaK/EbsC (Cys-tRNA(Pro) deacylase) [Mycetocola sp. CAN_C7]|uniref:YbaK/EbsC family protein n=1 Tax=Mycetocola sp. CAN_C7 TaxID=2787724 RepID=UPI0018CA5110
MTDNRPSHPTVERVLAELRAGGIGGDVRWFDDATPTAVHAAEALGVEVGAIANSLVFTLDGEPVLVLTSGAHRVDTLWLGEQLGGRLKRADAATVRSATGQVIGGVAPIGHPAPVRTFVDTALADYPEVWAAAGHPHTVFPTTFEQLVRLTGGTATAVEPG